jgi:hypothetical protein
MHWPDGPGLKQMFDVQNNPSLHWLLSVHWAQAEPAAAWIASSPPKAAITGLRTRNSPVLALRNRAPHTLAA